MTGFSHVPVLAGPVLTALAPRDGGTYIDGTLGGAGHSSLILEQSAPGGFLLGIDRDDDALRAAGERLQPFAGRFALVKGNYADMAELARQQGVTAADGVLLDIGVSSYQLDEAERGFSYSQDAPLDMRMDRSQALTAAAVVNTASAAELSRILYVYGEEKWAARIAAFIVEERARRPLETTGQLVEIIKKAVPAGARDREQHPAKRSFQALRIAVNGELDALRQGLAAAIGLLKPGGVLAVITFHSLEDRIVKDCFRLHAADCICPPRQPVCTCGHRADVKLYNRRPITASAAEVADNPRSRSANLRAVIKL
ncbi:MAG: 16S rRNA (cytosine(1402)-N(4))-methyltransferase RsmH [Firmicutes bacterium]|nr:16S rRNA (cytosine(1402)-N(4))-methyltransferase RsmH [Bacillota bacterium]